jgi:hypothetical protein
MRLKFVLAYNRSFLSNPFFQGIGENGMNFSKFIRLSCEKANWMINSR